MVFECEMKRRYRGCSLVLLQYVLDFIFGSSRGGGTYAIATVIFNRQSIVVYYWYKAVFLFYRQPNITKIKSQKIKVKNEKIRNNRRLNHIIIL